MNPWLETIAVVLLSGLSIFLGRILSRLRTPHWMWGYFLPLILITILIIAGYNSSATLFYWIAAGRVKFVVLSLAVTIGLTTPLSRLPHKFERTAVCVLASVVVIWFSVLPFFIPALIKNELSNLKTRLDADGICFQTKTYTCGPAAAVTALRKLGLSAHEGELAVLARSSPVSGTLLLSLCSALQARYGIDGLMCRYRHFDSVSQLENAGIILAVVKDGILSDHCVAVLKVSDSMVSVADPVIGKKLLTYEQFGKVWRFSGIVLKRNPEHTL